MREFLSAYSYKSMETTNYPKIYEHKTPDKHRLVFTDLDANHGYRFKFYLERAKRERNEALRAFGNYPGLPRPTFNWPNGQPKPKPKVDWKKEGF